jgi:hypothetical protein
MERPRGDPARFKNVKLENLLSSQNASWSTHLPPPNLIRKLEVQSTRGRECISQRLRCGGMGPPLSPLVSLLLRGGKIVRLLLGRHGVPNLGLGMVTPAVVRICEGVSHDLMYAVISFAKALGGNAHTHQVPGDDTKKDLLPLMYRGA